MFSDVYFLTPKNITHMENEKVVEILNALLTKNYDAEKGYKEASEKIDHSVLQTYFESQAKNRYDFGHQIKELILKYGGEPDKGTSVEADLHRVWISIKEAFNTGDKAVFDECIRGEEEFISEYERIIASEIMPADAKNLILSQKGAAEKSLHYLYSLEDFTQ